MNSITKNTLDFVRNIQNNRWLECNEKGDWWTVNFFTRWVQWIWSGDQGRIERISRTFIKALDYLEKQSDFDLDAKAYIKCGEEILKQTKMGELAWKVTALKYRIGVKEEGGLDPNENQEGINNLEKEALQWKETEPLYVKKELIEEEKTQLKAAARYPEFVKLLLDPNNQILRKKFFKWALREACDVDAFIQFPAVAQRLKSVYLDERIGHFRIKIYEENKKGKTCSLPIEIQEGETLKVERFSLLDETQEVILRKNYKVKISEIFSNLERSLLKPPNFEFFGKRRLDSGEILEPALISYNGLRCDSYDPETKDFKNIFGSKREFEARSNGLPKQIIPIDIIDQQKLKMIYGVDNIAKGKSLVIVRSTRKHPDLDFPDCHAFRDFVVPDENGQFEVYSFGKSTDKWPETTFQKISFLGKTHKARLVSPDKSYSSSKRQHAQKIYVFDEKQTKRFIKKTVKKFEKAEASLWYYQFPGKNCAYDTDSIVSKSLYPKEKNQREKVRNFRGKFTVVTPKNWFFRCWFRLIKVGGWTGAVAMRLFRFVAGTWRGLYIERPETHKKPGKVFKSLDNLKLLTEKNTISSPALFIHKVIHSKEKNPLEKVFMGNFLAPQN